MSERATRRQDPADSIGAILMVVLAVATWLECVTPRDRSLLSNVRNDSNLKNRLDVA